MALGIFDSGIGGLTVFKSIATRFPKLDMIYFGDTARVPYGNKSPETIVRYTLECTKHLVDNYKIDALVLACNTASSHALKTLHDEFHIPVLGVIDAGVKNAVDVSTNRKVAVIATHATIKSKSYNKVFQSMNEDVEIVSLPCPLFVPLVEEALIDGDMVETIVRETLKPIKNIGIDTIILGCTHYPVLKSVIAKVIPNVNIVDSTTYIVTDVLDLNINLEESGVRKILITDESHAFNSLKTILVGDIDVEVIKL